MTLLESYLIKFERELARHAVVDSRVVEEARGHLADAVDDGLQRGLSKEAAEREAIERFGTPEAVAARFASERRRARNWWVLLVMAIRRLLNASAPAVELFALNARSHYHDVPTRAGGFRVRIKRGALKGQPVRVMNATDAEEQLARFLMNPEIAHQMGTLESLKLLPDKGGMSTSVRKFSATFAGGAKMVWTVECASDGTIRSIDGTSES
ncbi:MAG: hypothetical protein C5B57_13370 [Blastocatellia bacterium]|nr:MAG: hypothetical protein C5B57_13370 [Blastocatellia bacterium]